MSEQPSSTSVVVICPEDRMRLETIVMDGDAEEALSFLKQVILRPLKESEAKGMRTRLRP